MVDLITGLGNPALLLLGSAALFGILFERGGSRAAVPWVVALAFCVALTVLGKLLFMTVRIYENADDWLNIVSPSGHTSFSLVFYGSLAAIAGIGRPTSMRWASYTAAILLVIAIGATRVLRDDHSVQEVALGFLFGSVSLLLFAKLGSRTQKSAIPWPPIGGVVIFVIGAAYLLSGTHLTAEGTLHRVAQKIGAQLPLATKRP